MTTVAFVSYEFSGQVRRVGPLDAESANTFAKEVSRKPGVKQVRLEAWACVDVKEVPCTTG